jgi:hypothetical protein
MPNVRQCRVEPRQQWEHVPSRRVCHEATPVEERVEEAPLLDDKGPLVVGADEKVSIEIVVNGGVSLTPCEGGKHAFR